MARTIKLTIAYDGTAYAGWQWQPEVPTIQGALEEAIHKITGERLRVIASGRTDAGVHALGQVVSFTTDSSLAAAVLGRALNAELPRDIAVLSAEKVAERFHATRDAVRKRYRYVLHDGRQPDVFRRRYAWHLWERLDEAAMHAAAQSWLGRHDFAAFESAGSQRITTVRTVYDATVARSASEMNPEPNVITFEIEADGFLYNMVRTMVGTLVEIGRGKRSVAWAAEVLSSRDRRLAGMKAPPEGLFLVRVDYDNI
ncbi:MAG TPA: tRNA pseudouridine(38-40) synthase TruA [Pirellulales bacterium]|jgi:tRNA pseudouridine38-40 synthase|nr:tRNA pseudouridine(38-40) synthase TruA [Pirellulales bacterium]